MTKVGISAWGNDKNEKMGSDSVKKLFNTNLVVHVSEIFESIHNIFIYTVNWYRSHQLKLIEPF